MDSRLKHVLESLLLHIHVLNEEIERLCRCEQFSPTSQSFQLLETIRGTCTSSLQTLRTIERNLYRSRPIPPNAEIFDFDNGK